VKYAEVEKAIEDNYIGETNEQSLKDAAAAAMVTSLGDKWSYYMTADEYKTYKLHSANEYAGHRRHRGKGRIQSGGFKLTSVIADTPADAGLTKDGIIMTVDGTDVTKLTVDGIRDLIQSKINSTITLGVSADGGSPADYKVDCSVVYNNPVSYELKPGNVGYIKISNFDAGSGDAAIEGHRRAAVPGGQIHSVRRARQSRRHALRAHQGAGLHTARGRSYLCPSISSGNETVTKSDNVCLQMKMTVLVNENTYSAAEYFAAALQEYNWATVVGTATTGKGRSQTTIELSDGSAVHISSRKYLTPKRVDLSQKGGITPDVVVNAGDGKDDPQLSKALELVKNS
jgi:carboxyl-terminal processing protease